MHNASAGDFVFDDYSFDSTTGVASFRYFFEGGLSFEERVAFSVPGAYNSDALERALFLAFILVGVSYYKTAPVRTVVFANHTIDKNQAAFLDHVYQEGLSQFAFENNLTRDDLAHFAAESGEGAPVAYEGEGVIQLQSGGKDSLLMATLLAEQGIAATPLYITSGTVYPGVIDQLGESPIVLTRTLDKTALQAATAAGGYNGHVPVTYIVLALSLVQAVLSNKQAVVASIGHEGEEPHGWIGDLPVNHQWSKTWQAEQLFARYVAQYVSSDLIVGSPLRQYSELKIAQLFAEKAWSQFSTSFSSCNVANYGQGVDNTVLTWCGACPKCANSYILFAPFIDQGELDSLFGGQSLYQSSQLEGTFRGLLGIDGVMKPFECIGEVDELRVAYHDAIKQGYPELPFTVPESHFDIDTKYPMQASLAKLVP